MQLQCIPDAAGAMDWRYIRHLGVSNAMRFEGAFGECAGTSTTSSNTVTKYLRGIVNLKVARAFVGLQSKDECQSSSIEVADWRREVRGIPRRAR